MDISLSSLDRKCRTIYAVDTSAAMLEYCQEHAEKVIELAREDSQVTASRGIELRQRGSPQVEPVSLSIEPIEGDLPEVQSERTGGFKA